MGYKRNIEQLMQEEELGLGNDRIEAEEIEDDQGRPAKRQRHL
jgi:hypothetical protein